LIYLNGDMAPATLRRAVAEYERVVQLDSTYVDAWGKITVVLNNLYSNATPDPKLAQRSRDAVARVARLAPNTAIARRVQAHYFLVRERNAPRALAELTAAKAMAPGDASIHSPLAGTYIALGRFDDAVNSAELVQRLDPRSPGPLAQLTMIYRFLRRYPEARSVTERQLLLIPNVSSVQDRAMVALGEGELVGARRVFQEWEQRLGRDDLLTYFATYWDLGWVPDDAGQERLLSFGPDRFDNDRAIWAIVRAQLYGWRSDSTQARVWGDTAARERGVALNPLEQYYPQGMYLRHQLARIYLLTGEHAKRSTFSKSSSPIPTSCRPGGSASTRPLRRSRAIRGSTSSRQAADHIRNQELNRRAAQSPDRLSPRAEPELPKPQRRR
jgi:hypothetical protein